MKRLSQKDYYCQESICMYIEQCKWVSSIIRLK